MNASCGCRCRLVPRCAKRPSARARKSSMRLSQACLASSLAPERNSEAMASACARGLRRLARTAWFRPMRRSSPPKNVPEH